MWQNIVERGWPQPTIWHMRIAWWITKAINTHSQYVILIAFPLQQWLHERAAMLRYTYSVYLATRKALTIAFVMVTVCVFCEVRIKYFYVLLRRILYLKMPGQLMRVLVYAVTLRQANLPVLIFSAVSIIFILKVMLSEG